MIYNYIYCYISTKKLKLRLGEIPGAFILKRTATLCKALRCVLNVLFNQASLVNKGLTRCRQGFGLLDIQVTECLSKFNVFTNSYSTQACMGDVLPWVLIPRPHSPDHPTHRVESQGR